MIKRIVLITGSHLSSNPRLVKEAEALFAADFTVNILCAQNLDNLAIFDEEIFKNLKGINIKIINYQNRGLLSRYLRIKSTLRLKLSKLRFFSSFKTLKFISQSRMLPEMKSVLKDVKADLYIAHTIAALPAAAWASKYHNSKYAFDAEDFHRGETNAKEAQTEVIKLEDEFLPRCAYISTASPFSTEIYRQNYPDLNIITLNNFFPRNIQSTSNSSDTGPLKIVWFSQTIGLNRGLQEFFKKVNNLNSNNFEIHLRGAHTAEIKQSLFALLCEDKQSKLFFHPQCSPYFLESWLTTFDVGLALEPRFNLNNNIAISNKIFQYINAGLAVVATPTTGQNWVIQQAPDAGIVLLPDSNLDILKNWDEDRACLEDVKKAALIAAKNKFNWNDEKKKLIEVIRQIQID